MTLKLRVDMQYQIRSNIRKELKVADSKEYKSSVIEECNSSEYYSNKLNQFIKSLINNEYVLKQNDFTTKYSSFAKVVSAQGLNEVKLI